MYLNIQLLTRGQVFLGHSDFNSPLKIKFSHAASILIIFRNEKLALARFTFHHNLIRLDERGKERRRVRGKKNNNCSQAQNILPSHPLSDVRLAWIYVVRNRSKLEGEGNVIDTYAYILLIP